MTMNEIVEQVAFMLGIPANDNVEDLQIEKAVLIAFRELKRYIKTPTEKTVPFNTRISLKDVGIDTRRIVNVRPASPRVGITLTSLDTGNVFQLAANINSNAGIIANGLNNTDRITHQLALTQLRNTLTQDFEWKYDSNNDVIYITHSAPKPQFVTIHYVPDYKDVSEINGQMWIDYLVRLSEAYMKKSLGRSRSKYRIEGSNVSLDGETLLQEANAELEQIRNELSIKEHKLVVVN